jgi:uncharacterized protein (TIGR03435 family)
MQRYLAPLLSAALLVGALTALQAQQEVGIVIGGAAPPAAPGAPPGPMSFEVASVKQNVSGDQGIRFGMQPGGRFNAVNAPVRELIRFAYLVQNFQIVDAPDWIREDRYDITAKAEGDIPPSPPGQLGPMQMMMRSLLADRFKLVVREDTREQPLYALMLNRADGQLGPQLTRSTTDCAAVAAAARGRGGRGFALPAPGERPQCGFFGGIGQYRAGGMQLSDLARALSGQLQRVVIDRTGLTGAFDLDLTYTPDQLPQGPPPPGAPPLPAIDPNGPSIFTAMQEQLGLKLEATRGPVPVLVVQRIERPTPD